MKITLDQFKKCLPRLPRDKAPIYFVTCTNAMAKGFIDTPKEVAMFLAQIGHESNDCSVLEENLNYRATRLVEVFPKYFPTTTLALQYAGKPKSIASRVYASRMGNGNEASKDGYRFRGRGVIQLTGRSNYRTYGRLIGMPDLEQNPDKASQDPSVMFALAVAFWNSRGLSTLAESGAIRQVTRAINGGFNGLADRQARYTRNLAVLGG